MPENKVHKLYPDDVLNAKTLHSDLAAEMPLYLYLPDDKGFLVYSESVRSLLNDDNVSKPLEVSEEGVSFLLRSGVVPPPKTVYSNLYILGIGGKAKVTTDGQKIALNFEHNFPFLNSDRLSPEEMKPDEDKILKLVAEAAISRVDSSRPTFLFHSAGKDSNTIALALAEAGWQERVTLVTHRSIGEKDESEISAQIAHKLGFSHCILHANSQPSFQEKRSVERNFYEASFPSMDKVTLAYPFYAHQMPVLEGANLLDGMGNDVYIGHVPSFREYKGQQRSSFLQYGRSISKHYRAESVWHSATRSRAEWCGLGGFSWADSKKIFPNSCEASSFWRFQDLYRDYLDLRAFVRGRVIDQEVFMRKLRNFGEASDSKVVYPFANERVAKYFSMIPERYLFDRKLLKNKLILRKMLNKRIGLDCDAIGKKGFSYNYSALMKENWGWCLNEIRRCRLWDNAGLEKVLFRLEGDVLRHNRRAFIAEHPIYRLYLISAWFNYNKYINVGT